MCRIMIQFFWEIMFSKSLRFVLCLTFRNDIVKFKVHRLRIRMHCLTSISDKERMYKFILILVQTWEGNEQECKNRRCRFFDAIFTKKANVKDVVRKNSFILSPRCVLHIGLWCLEVQKRSIIREQNK